MTAIQAWNLARAAENRDDLANVATYLQLARCLAELEGKPDLAKAAKLASERVYQGKRI